MFHSRKNRKTKNQTTKWARKAPMVNPSQSFQPAEQDTVYTGGLATNYFQTVTTDTRVSNYNQPSSHNWHLQSSSCCHPSSNVCNPLLFGCPAVAWLLKQPQWLSNKISTGNRASQYPIPCKQPHPKTKVKESTKHYTLTSQTVLPCMYQQSSQILKCSESSKSECSAWTKCCADKQGIKMQSEHKTISCGKLPNALKKQQYNFKCKQ